MERRYQLFADAGARNITTYNERVEKVLKGELAVEKLTPKRSSELVVKAVQTLIRHHQLRRPDRSQVVKAFQRRMLDRT